MARDFNGTTSKVQATITAADSGDWTIGGWFFIDATGDSATPAIVRIETAGAAAVQVARIVWATKRLTVFQGYSVTLALTETNDNGIVASGWVCFFGTFRASDSKCRIYVGDLDSPISEASYASQTAGGGTRTTSGTIACIGNRPAQDISFDGRIERPFFTARELSVDEMERFRLGDYPAVLGTGLRGLWPLDSPTAAQCEDLSGNGANGTHTSTTAAEGPPVPWGAVGPVQVLPTTAQSVSAGLATETDTAFAATAQKRAAVGTTSETDTALAPTAQKRVAVGIAIETDTALGATAQKRAAVGLATETDTALTPAARKQVAVGVATETDTALSPTVRKDAHVGLATEIDTAFGAHTPTTQNVDVGIATETDTAFGATRLVPAAAGDRMARERVVTHHTRTGTAQVRVRVSGQWRRRRNVALDDEEVLSLL